MIKNPLTKLLGSMHLIEPGVAAKTGAKAARYPGVRDAIVHGSEAVNAMALDAF